MLFLNWRNVLVFSIGLRFFFALTNSYIHPDEHFQSFEPLAESVFKFSTNPPWEFKLADPARSMAPLLLMYYPAMQLSRWLQMSPLQSWYLVRLVLMLASWMTTDWFLYKMLPTKQERIKAIFFVLTSYVSLVYQSHTFSNSVETVLVITVVFMINELRFFKRIPTEQVSKKEVALLGIFIGALSSFGIFNRVTFPAYVILPSFFLISAILKWKFLLPCLLLGFGSVTAICILLDTIYYKRVSLDSVLHHLYTYQFSYFIVTPLNNLVYNSLIKNLSEHGLHPVYTHMAVNLPQILGPGLLFLFGKGKNIYWKTTPFLSAAGGVLFLSFIPHQELRFLLPVIPLFCSCFDMTVFDRFKEKAMNYTKFTLKLWFLFNIVLSLLMGIFHQGGVVPAMNYFYNLPVQPKNIIFWRTYMAPTWMLGDTKNSTQFIRLNDDNLSYKIDSKKTKTFIDTMGMLYDRLSEVLHHTKQDQTYFVTPIASFNKFFNASEYERVWSYGYHLDMDHLDFSDISTLRPGLGVYKLL